MSVQSHNSYIAKSIFSVTLTQTPYKTLIFRLFINAKFLTFGEECNGQKLIVLDVYDVFEQILENQNFGQIWPKR